MFNIDTLRDAVVAKVYRHPSTQKEIVKYYQETYTGKEGRSIAWKKHLVEDLLRERGITPENTDSKEYARQKKNLGKRFESRAKSESAGAKSTAEYKTFGNKLPKILPPEEINYSVRVYGEIRISTQCRPVDFTVTVGGASKFSLQGENAENFTDNPNVYDLVIAYWQGDDPGYNGWCEGPYFEVIV